MVSDCQGACLARWLERQRARQTLVFLLSALRTPGESDGASPQRFGGSWHAGHFASGRLVVLVALDGIPGGFGPDRGRAYEVR